MAPTGSVNWPTSQTMSYPPLEELTLLHASICRAMADPKRILILYALNERPRHVTALADELELPQSTVSRHLRTLRHHSLVISERDGSSVVYHLSDRRIISLLDLMGQVMFDVLTHKSTLINQYAGP